MTSASPKWDGLLLDCRLATMRDGPDAYGMVEAGALGWKDGLITLAGPQAQLPGNPQTIADAIFMAEGECVTPALIDCHTHLVFAGNRAIEFERRLQGASYEQIPREGGGIIPTVRPRR